MKNNFQNLIISKNTSLRKALQKMDETGRKLLIVEDKNKFYSLLSIGDIQRAIIRENNLEIEVQTVLRKNIKVAYVTDNLEEIKEEMKIRRNEFMPVLSQDGIIKDVIFWDNLFDHDLKQVNPKIDLPIVIMAGGKGARLKPLTNILPKALIPIGEKTILERILDSFTEFGSKRFYISVNYKAEMIRYYMDQLSNPAYFIEYFEETQPLGTAGSLHLLKGQINETFFISNCDILIEQDYNEILNYHRENNNEITLVAAIKSTSIPYGILHTRQNGLLEYVEEKPELSYKINTGLYILEPHLIDEIPPGQFFHITDLIEKIRKKGRRIGVFPVSSKSWTDIGTWNEYLNNHVI